MRRPLFCLSILLVASVTTLPAKACDNSPDLARVPGSSDAEAERRYLAYESDLGVIARLESEKAALEESWTVYLGTIDSVERGEVGGHPKGMSVTPVWPVRGTLPKGRQRITLPTSDQSCRARGFLGLNYVETGRLVVVFERPGSEYAVSAEVARTGELINAITMYALKVDPAQFK